MALASALLASVPGGAVAAGRKGLVGFFGIVRVNPHAAATAVPAVTYVVPRNMSPCHWPGMMQIQTEPRTDRPPPWNYKTRPMNWKWQHIDTTTDRFDEYTRIIVVDGNIGSGKSTVAKEIAKAFDLLYFPEPDSRLIYNGTPPFNYDLRDASVQSKLHPRNRKYDLDDFYQDPNKRPGRAGELQLQFLEMRYRQYNEATLHLLSTGQGVVLDRSIYSDHVFAETLRDQGFMSRKVHNWYKFLSRNVICNHWKPHMTIYLDCPVETCMQRIKDRGIPSEVNCEFLNEDYLATIEKHYKTSFLPEMELSGELVVSEHPDYDDVEELFEEITRRDFTYEIDDPKKFVDWRYQKDSDAMDHRIECGNDDFQQKVFQIPGKWRIGEVWIDGQLEEEKRLVYQSVADRDVPVGYTPGWDSVKTQMFDFGRAQRNKFYYLDNMATPVLGKEYETTDSLNNPLASATN